MTTRLARGLACAALLSLLAASPPGQAQPAAPAVAAPVLKWQRGGCRSTWCRTGWYASPSVADLDGDGQVEVIWADYRIVVVAGASGDSRWTVNTPGGGRTWPDPVVADIDGNGTLEIVAAHSGGYVSVTRPDGTALAGWPQQPTPGSELRSLAVGDVDGDGDLEIAVASTRSDNQWFLLDHTGATRAGWPKQTDSNTTGYAAGCFNQNVGLADIDDDGRLELVGPNDTHYVSAFRHDGTAVPANAKFGQIDGQDKVWARVGFHYSEAVDLRGYANCSAGTLPLEPRPNFANSAPTIADVDGDGTPEIIIVGNQYDCRANPYASLFDSPYILRADRTRWASAGFDWTSLPVPDAQAGPRSEDYNVIETAEPNPVVADLDGDGLKEILYASYDGRVHAYWLDRTEHGSWPYRVTRDGEWFIRFGSEPAVVDLNNDGRAEVILTTWTQKGSSAAGQLLVLSWDGTLLHAVDLPRDPGQSWDGAMAAPTVANIDGDPDLEVVIGTAHTGLVAYDLPGTSTARVLWGTGRGGALRSGAAPSESVPDEVTITAGPTGTPNPAASGQVVALSVIARDSLGHPLTYQWSATCPVAVGGHGAFSDPAAAAPTWTAPINTTGVATSCTIGVTVSDGVLSDEASYTQGLSAGATLYRRYFAEGATIPPFDCRFAIANPNDAPATVTLRFQRNDRRNFLHALTVPARSRRTLDAKSVDGLQAAEFSTVVESDLAVVADRTMVWDASGYAGHTETSLEQPATTWYLAEGATHSGFDLFYTIQNPNAAVATVAIRYLRTGGRPPLDKVYRIPASTRLTVWVNGEQIPEGSGVMPLAAAEVSARITSDLPIVVERSMYLSRSGVMFRAGHCGAAVTAPAVSWFLSEGATGRYFDLFILIANPNDVPAVVRGTYLLPNGTTVVKDYVVPANSRYNIAVDSEEFPAGSGNRALADTAVSPTMASLNEVPIIVERAMWWPGPTWTTWAEAHNSAGSTATGTLWALAEGEEGGPRHVQTYITVANTSAHAGLARVTMLFEDGAAPVESTVALRPNSRTNVRPPELFPAAFPAGSHRRFATIVESLGAEPAQIVVERPMYWDANGVTWSAGTNAVGTRVR